MKGKIKMKAIKTKERKNKAIFSAGTIKQISVWLLVIVLFLGSKKPVYAADEKKTLPSGIAYDEIGSQIEAYVKEHKDTSAAMAVTIFDREGTIYQNHFGYIDLENQKPIEEESVFEWGSATKTLVWISVMQLVEQGRLDLKEDIRTYLPDRFLTNLNYDKPVTMINLMNHNAGFQEMLTDLFVKDYKNVLPLAEQLKLHEPKQIYEPGTVTAYSNWGVALAAYIVEFISGQSFDEYAREHIFEKLGMEHTAIRPDLSDNEWVKEKRQELMCYSADGKAMGDCSYAISLYPAGMCTSTLGDFSLFAQSLVMAEGEKCHLFDKEETLTEMFSATSYYGDTDIPLNCHGFWTQEFGVSVMGHGGNTAGCSSNLMFHKESGIGVVVMTNQQNEEIFNYDMLELIFGSFADSKLAGYNQQVPKGFFRSARTILTGPLSVYSMGFYVMEESDLDDFWVYDDSQGVEKIVSSYGDTLKLSPDEYIPIIVLPLLLAAGALYALSTCLAGGCIVSPLLRLRKKKQGIPLEKIPFAGWNYAACALMLLWLVNFGVISLQISTYAPSSHYIWQFALSAVMGIMMLSMAGSMIYHLKKMEQPVRRKVKYGVTTFFLFVFLVVILYWNMYQFWAV